MALTKITQFFQPKDPLREMMPEVIPEMYNDDDKAQAIVRHFNGQHGRLSAIDNSDTWRQKDLALIYASIDGKRRCYLNDEDGKSFQTILLALDLESQYLILDELFPAAPSSLHYHETTLTLRDPNSYAALCIRIQINHQTRFQGRSAHAARIVSSQWHNDRRLYSRTFFTPTKAPLVQLTIPMLSQLNGRIENLSAGGAQILITGIVPKPHELGPLDKSPAIDCLMILSNDLDIKCRAQIRSYKLERQPSLRARSRLLFTDISDSDRSMLYTIVELANM